MSQILDTKMFENITKLRDFLDKLLQADTKRKNNKIQYVVEYYSSAHSKWCNKPISQDQHAVIMFYPDIKYRIAKQPREFWINSYPPIYGEINDMFVHESHDTAKQQEEVNFQERIYVREVFEDHKDSDDTEEPK